jgi:hypothetical protein
MILKKIALPVGVDGKSYWEIMLLGLTNDKFCSLRDNFRSLREGKLQTRVV